MIIMAIIKGTKIKVAFELTPEQYVHYEYLRGRRVDESMPMDQNIVGEMAALLEHLEGRYQGQKGPTRCRKG